MGASFRSYLLRVRIAKAEQLLRDSGRTITEIAQMVGFGDLPRFDKVFRRATGMPPSVYRDRLRRKQAAAH
jgi:two-component system response regulator YesN